MSEPLYWLHRALRIRRESGDETGSAQAHAELVTLLAERDRMRAALEDLRPGLVLDLRYAGPDDDCDALRSRVETVERALARATDTTTTQHTKEPT